MKEENNAQLISTIDEFHIWAEDYDKEYMEFFDIQDDVSAAIASNLLTTLSSNDEKKIKTNRTSSTEAYEYYIKGMYFHHNKLLSSWDKIDFISSEKMLILRMLKQSDFNKRKTAALLEISRKTLYNKLKKYGISLTETG